jgi:hypothetical protein
MKITGCCLAVWFSAAALVPDAGCAQDRESRDVQLRTDCRLAAQIMRTGHPRPQYQWARGYISICDAEGPEVLAAEWGRVGRDTADIYFLIRSSARIRDARIYEALRRSAMDRSRADVVRVGAMIALTRYVDPHNAIGFPDVRPPSGGIRRIPLVSNWTTGGGQSKGAVPLQGPAAPEVQALLQQIASARATERPEIWYAAAVLAKRVEADIRLGRAR